MDQLHRRQNIGRARIAPVGEAVDRMENVGSGIAGASVPQEVLLADRERHAAEIMRNGVVGVLVDDAVGLIVLGRQRGRGDLGLMRMKHSLVPRAKPGADERAEDQAPPRTLRIDCVIRLT